jgi:type I restriction enzyme R subunit
MSEDFYESKIPKMIVCNAFGVACNDRVAKYGVPGNSSSYFADWKDMSVDMTPGKRTHRGGVLLQL